MGCWRFCGTFSSDGIASDRVFQYAYLNASLETGFPNPIDIAIRTFKQPDISAFANWTKSPMILHGND